MILVLLTVFCFSVAIHLCYYLGVFSFFSFGKSPQQQQKNNISPLVSIIICAKNEADNLTTFLPTILNQRYPDFEVVVINDRSYDNSLDILEEFEKQYQHLKIVDVAPNETFHSNKKYALTLGIKAASHDILLFTDADCIPKSEYWLQQMVNNTIKTPIVLGYGAYQQKPGFLNQMIRYETLITAVQYFSYAKIGIPYMGVGRNLMYSKEIFFKNKGFNEHINFLSGDDDLFINQVAHKKNTSINYHSNAHTVSNPKTTLKDWLHQKKRHISTANLYKKKHQFLLGTYAFNRLLFLIMLIILSLIPNKPEIYNYIFWGTIALKFLSEYLIIGLASRKLDEKNIAIWTPFLDIFLLIVQLYIFVYNKTSTKHQRW